MLDSDSGFALYLDSILTQMMDVQHILSNTRASQLLLQLPKSGPRHRTQWVFSLDFHRPFGQDLETFITSHRPMSTDKGPKEVFQGV